MWWKIWYEVGEITGTTVEEWVVASDEGVVAIYEHFKTEDGINYGRISSGSDWYWMLPNGEVGHNLESSDKPDTWVDVVFPKDAVAKKGKWVSSERLKEVEEALNRLVQGTD